ncbi:lipopolysaccharide biosynthesis protein [Facklamia sp. P13055]|uniref:lipopolysaccharide biosynthesis protein n=1 Tax=Facklamia sp. P13055 TaxID=3421952 RepID=UPI003D17770C
MKRDISELKVGVVLSYISKLIQIMIGVLYTPIMIRLLGQNEYGLYNISASLVSYLSILNFGFGSAYMRFYSRYKALEDKEEISKLNGMFLMIFLILGIIVVIAGSFLTFNIEFIFGKSLSIQEINTAKILMLVLILNLAISFVGIVFNTFVQANEKFIFYNSILIFKQISTPFISLPLLLLGKGSLGMVLAMTLINLLCEIIIIHFSLKKLKMGFSFEHFDNLLFKEMSIYSLFIFINIIVDQVNNNVDKTILGRYQGAASVAIYSVGSNINMYYIQMSSTIASVFTPRIHRMVAIEENDSGLSDLFIKVGRIQFIILSLICSGFFIFGKFFIKIWAGEQYNDSYFIAILLMIPITIPLIQNIGIEIQRAKDLHHFRSLLYFFISILNIIISIPLAIKFGGIGSAIGTSFSYIIGNGIIMNWYYSSKVGLNIKEFWDEILSIIPSLVPPILFGVGCISYDKNITLLDFFIYAFVYTLLFIISIWKFGLNSYEKKLISSSFKQLNL